MRRDGAACVGLVLVTLFVIAAIFAPWIEPHDPQAQDIARRLIQAFVERLELRLSGADQAGPAATELRVGSLVFSVMIERVKAWLRRIGHGSHGRDSR